VQGWLLARDLSITVAAVLFSLWVTFAAGYSAVYQAMVVVLAGIILYAFVRARREHLGQIPAPTDLAGGAGGRPPASQQSLTAVVTRGENPEGQS